MKKNFIKILTSFVIIVGVILSSMTSLLVNGATINYTPFEYLIGIDSSLGHNEYNGYIGGTINNGVLTSDYQEIIITSNVALDNTLYLCKLVYDVDNYYILDSNYYIKFDDFIQMGLDNYYGQGYDSGVATTDYQSAYQSGYDIGTQAATTYYENERADLQSYYQGELATQQEYYEERLAEEVPAAFQQGKAAGYDEANQLIEEDEVYQATVGFKFQKLLNTIFMYPIRVFTEALNVEIFGINVGGILLTVMAISIISLVIFFIKKVL